MPSDTDTLSFALTYGGTLAVALLLFVGQLTAVGVLLVFAGIVRLVTGDLSRPSSGSVLAEN